MNTILTHHGFEIEGKNIRHTVTAGGEVLYEKTIKHPDNKQMNLAMIFDIYHPVIRGRFYERPEVMDWIDPQKTIDKVYSNIETTLTASYKEDGCALMKTQRSPLPVLRGR